MTTFLCVGDPHFSTKNVENCQLMVQKLLALVQQLKPDQVVLLGDILHTHEKIHVHALRRAEKMITALAELCPTVLLIGNHDRPNNSVFCTDEHAFNSLKGWKNITIVDKPVRLLIKEKPYVYVPYVAPGRFQEALNQVEWKDARIIFGHQEFFKCKMGAIESSEGDKWPLDYPMVISGHIHEYQKLQSNIIYPGTPIQQSFSESSKKKVLLVTDQDQKFEFKRIDLGVPPRVTIHLRCSEVGSYELKAIGQIKIVVTGTPEECKLTACHLKIARWRDAGVTIVFKVEKKQEAAVVGQQINFQQLLLEKLKDPAMQELCQELFRP